MKKRCWGGGVQVEMRTEEDRKPREWSKMLALDDSISTINLRLWTPISLSVIKEVY